MVPLRLQPKTLCEQNMKINFHLFFNIRTFFLRLQYERSNATAAQSGLYFPLIFFFISLKSEIFEKTVSIYTFCEHMWSFLRRVGRAQNNWWGGAPCSPTISLEPLFPKKIQFTGRNNFFLKGGGISMCFKIINTIIEFYKKSYISCTRKYILSCPLLIYKICVLGHVD